MVLRRSSKIAAWVAALVLAASARSAPAGEYYALLIGVEKYNDPRLKVALCAEKDVADLAETLLKSGYKREHVVLLSNAAGISEKRFAPTAVNIRRELKLLLLTMSRDDALLLFFSGHGVQIKGEKDFLLFPVDARPSDKNSLVSLHSLYELLANSKLCIARSKILLIDALRGDPRADVAWKNDLLNPEPEGFRILPEPPAGISALFSCSSGERSQIHRESGRGLFMESVLTAISPPGDFNKDGRISFAELEGFVLLDVPQYSRGRLNHVQTPCRLGERRKSVSVASVEAPRPTPFDSKGFDPKSPGQERSDNSRNIVFVWCPPGEFMMGSPRNESGRSSDEYQAEVKIRRGFWLGKYEITQKQLYGQNFVYESDCPAKDVSWWDAHSFCRILTDRERLAGQLGEDEEYTLPTEAQWEYACRAGTVTPYSFEGDAKSLKDFGWFIGNTGLESFVPVQIGQKVSNRWGLHDMHGNVAEWCRDSYRDVLIGGVDPVAKGDDELPHVVKGGSWRSPAEHCRSASRDSAESRHVARTIGFRIARVAVRPSTLPKPAR